MANHVWEKETIDGGHLGVDDFWHCSACGAAGGPVGLFGEKEEPTMHPFLADGSGLRLSTDCDESKKIIKAYHTGLRDLVFTLQRDLEKTQRILSKANKRISRLITKTRNGGLIETKD